MGDAVKAMIAWCDAQGGINGRKVVGDYYDAAVTNVGTVMTQACKTDFMLVGEGFALDGTAEQTRLGCNLAAVPGFTVSPVVANAYEMYQAAPNPANASPVSIAYQGEKLFGSKTQHVGQYNSTLSTQEASMAKAVQAYTTAGWKFVDCPFEVNYNGEANYTPFVQKLQTCARRSSSTTPPPDPPSMEPSKRPTRSVTTRSGCSTRPSTRRPSRSGTPAGWATTSTSASGSSRWRRRRSCPPWPSTSPSSRSPAA